jgi:hypothetical protein
MKFLLIEFVTPAVVEMNPFEAYFQRKSTMDTSMVRYTTRSAPKMKNNVMRMDSLIVAIVVVVVVVVVVVDDCIMNQTNNGLYSLQKCTNEKVIRSHSHK